MMWTKKILFGLGATTALLFGGPMAFTATQVALLPDNERLVAPVDRIVVAQTGVAEVKYAYLTDREIPAEPGEVVELRTERSTTKRVGNKFVATFGDFDKHKVGNKWYALNWATTTRRAYDLQNKSIVSLPINIAAATTDTYTADDTWTAPADVCSVDLDTWGAGGHGSNSASGGGGGGGGAYSGLTGLAVTPSVGYTLQVGQPVTNAAGEDTWFSTTGVAPTNTSQGALAKGGSRTSNTSGAAGGTAAASIGTTKNNGGTGGAGNGGAFNRGGGGGGSGGGGGAGGTGGASGTSGGVGGTAGAATPAGAAGGHGSNTKTNGTAPGGGGGGGDGFGNTPSSGARGEVRVTYTTDPGCGAAAPEVKVPDIPRLF